MIKSRFRTADEAQRPTTDGWRTFYSDADVANYNNIALRSTDGVLECGADKNMQT